MNTIKNKNKHLTHEERCIIEPGIRNGSSKKAIADTLGKNTQSMLEGIELLDTILGSELFNFEVQVLLTDYTEKILYRNLLILLKNTIVKPFSSI